MTITLHDREREALIRLLETGLEGLRFEAARVDRHRDATVLWEDERILDGLLERLREEDRPAP